MNKEDSLGLKVESLSEIPTTDVKSVEMDGGVDGFPLGKGSLSNQNQQHKLPIRCRNRVLEGGISWKWSNSCVGVTQQFKFQRMSSRGRPVILPRRFYLLPTITPGILHSEVHLLEFGSFVPLRAPVQINANTSIRLYTLRHLSKYRSNGKGEMGMPAPTWQISQFCLLSFKIQESPLFQCGFI